MTLPFKSIWIVGASSGIGRHTALAMARAGVTVIASARSADDLNALADEGPPGGIIPIPFDATDPEAAQAAFRLVKQSVGELDALLYGAATWAPDEERLVSREAVEKVYRVNILGCLNVLELVVPHMQERRTGRIAVISSVAGFRGLPRALAYGSSKAALTHMCETLRLQLASDNIIVQAVHPGFVRTPLTDKNDFPMPFLMEPDDAAQRIVDGMSRDGFEITFPRRFTWMLKLLRCLPYALYFALVGRATQGKGGKRGQPDER